MFRTANSLTLPVSGTGSAGMEAAFVNVVGPGDVVVVGVNGLFGERMCDVAAAASGRRWSGWTPLGESHSTPTPWWGPIGPPTVIALVHAETSTGVRNDVEEVARGKGDALLLVDAVTSLGGIAFDADRWGADLAYSGTQKCLGVPPGLSPFTVSDRARARLKDRPSSWYFDLGLIARYVEGEGGRTYHHTAPVSMVFALHAGLGVLLEEGLEHAWARHAACGHALQSGLEKLGFELVVPAEHRLPQLTTVWVPDDLGGMTEADVTIGAAAPLRDRDRGRRGRDGGPGVAYRLHGPHGSDAQRRAAPGRAGGGAGKVIGRTARATPLELSGGRIRLRTLSEDDYEGWFEVRARCRRWLVPWEPRPAGAPLTPEDRASFSARCAARERERQMGSGYGFGIFVADRFVGEITLSSIQRGPFQNAFVGYWVDEAMAGQGLAPEATVAVLRFAFEELGLHRVEIAIVPRNRASRRVVEKLNLREEGVAVRYLEIDGHWEDHVRYAMTAEEWTIRAEVLVRQWLTGPEGRYPSERTTAGEWRKNCSTSWE